MIVTIVEMHQLNKLENKVPVTPDIIDKIVHFVVIDPIQDDHIKFDRGKTGLKCGTDPGKHFIKPVAPSDLFVGIVIQAVETDVNPAKPGVFQFPGHIREQDAIGREG
jgi:hypothetical protein